MSNYKGPFKAYGYKLSTAQEAFEAIRSEQLQYDPLPRPDLLPVSTIQPREGDVIWSGFFFSRPGFKKDIKEFSETFRGVTNILAFNALRLKNSSDKSILKATQDLRGDNYNEYLEEVKFTSGILTHHDAITGTCYATVVRDYYRMIRGAMESLNNYASPLLSKILGLQESSNNLSNIQISPNTTLEYKAFEKLQDPILFILNQEAAGTQVIRIEVPQTVSVTLSTNTQPSTQIPEQSLICTKSLCEYSYLLHLQAFEIRELKLAHTILTAEQLKSRLPTQVPASSVQVGSLNIRTKDGVIIIEENGDLILKVSVTYFFNSVINLEDRQIVQIGMYAMKTYYKVPFTGTPVRSWYTVNKDKSVVFSVEYAHPITSTLSIHVPAENIQSPEDAPEGTSFLSADQKRFYVRTEFHNLKGSDDIDIFARYVFPGDEKSQRNSFYTDSNGQFAVPRELIREKRVEDSVYPVVKVIGYEGESWVEVDRATAGTLHREGGILAALGRLNISKDRMGAPDLLEMHDCTAVRHYPTISRKNTNLPGPFRRIYGRPLLALTTGAIDFSTPFKGITPKDNLPVRSLLDVRKDGTMVRLYNTFADKTITIDNVKEFIKQRYGIERDIEIEERSLDYNLPITTILNQPYAFRNVTALKESYEKETINGGRGALLQSLRIKTYKILNK